MRFEVYAIKDELAGTFGNLMVVNPKVAARTMRWMTEEMERADCADKRVYKLADYNNETGEIIPNTPEMVYNIEQAKKELQNDKNL